MLYEGKCQAYASCFKERGQLVAALKEGMEQTSALAGKVMGILDGMGENAAFDSNIQSALRWEYKTRQILGMPPEEVSPEDTTPWARAMRLMLAMFLEG